MPTLKVQSPSFRQRHIQTQSGSWVTEKLHYSKSRVRNGYEQIKSSIRDWVYTHRVTAEDALGRWLKHSEQVHHIDGDKENNSPSNLLVCDRSYHKLLHKRCLDTHNSWHLPS